jgi:hypothetical protein
MRNFQLKIHLAATLVAVLTIVSFFFSSLLAELSGELTLIKSVKAGILYTLPLLLLAMFTLKTTGDWLAGRSTAPAVLAKKKRMKLAALNGGVLVSLAIFLYYHSHFHPIGPAFWVAQGAELLLGLVNLMLIALNTRSGFQLSGRLAR